MDRREAILAVCRRTRSIRATKEKAKILVFHRELKNSSTTPTLVPA
jgi:hypothetical protein